MRLRLHDLAWQELDDEIVVLDLRGSAYFRLNNSGSLLWRRLIDGGERADLEAVLIEQYELDPGQAASDVDAFLAQLTTHRFLEAGSG